MIKTFKTLFNIDNLYNGYVVLTIYTYLDPECKNLIGKNSILLTIEMLNELGYALIGKSEELK